jgi:hypothetical protein
MKRKPGTHANCVRSATLVSLGIVMTLTQTSCASVQVKLGWKVYLEKIPISSIRSQLAEGSSHGAGRNVTAGRHDKTA